MTIIRSVYLFFRAILLSRVNLAAENLALRQQIIVLQRSAKRPKIARSDRAFWAWLSKLWPGWRSALITVQPETVIGVAAGDKIWRVASDRPLDKLKVDEETRKALRRTYFYPPLPCVKRVIFISTPHRGSYRVSSFVRRVARWFISLPVGALKLTVKAIQYPLRRGSDDGKTPPPPNSIDGMSPDNKYLHVVAAAPFARGVKAHSIIAIDGDDRPPEGNDGVVAYRSAHLNKVESEVIVRSGHSCQGTPTAIEEVRRILLEHLASLPGTAPAAKGSAP